jgi:hypothetical protein
MNWTLVLAIVAFIVVSGPIILLVSRRFWPQDRQLDQEIAWLAYRLSALESVPVAQVGELVRLKRGSVKILLRTAEAKGVVTCSGGTCTITQSGRELASRIAEGIRSSGRR